MDRPGDRKTQVDDGDATPAPTTDDDWVHELIAMSRPGVEINLPFRGLGDRVIPFEFDDFD